MNRNEIKLRSATLDDLSILYEFEQAIITVERPFDPTLKPDPINYYDIRAMIHSDETEVIVALMGSDIIGSAYASIKNSKLYQKHKQFAYLGFMYVKPEFRGRGVNQKIIDQLKQWAKSKNIKELRLEVYSDNQPAIRAYEKAGFTKNLVEMRFELG